jgi:hypothetical protein
MSTPIASSFDSTTAAFSPRGGKLGRAIGSLDLDSLARLLDDEFSIPGTRIRFGLDAIVGLIPGVGDVWGGIASCGLVAAAWFQGLPYSALARMSANVGIDVLGGAIPLAGEAFDIAWKANRRNLNLMRKYQKEPRRQQWKDRIFLVALGCVFVFLFALPIALLGAGFYFLFHLFG